MRKASHRNGFWFLLFAALLACVGLIALQEPMPAQAGLSVELQAPPLQDGAVTAQEAATLSTIADEAGIAAYFNALAPVDLNKVAGLFRTIEARTDSYILGSLAVPGYNERHDVHIYVHRDGWFMAYYLAADPAAKMVDMKGYAGTVITTKFETLLTLLASAAGVNYVQPTFWDFRSPNANRMMVLAETSDGGADFTVRLPGTFVYFDRSWASGGFSPGLFLDGKKVTEQPFADQGVAEGNLSPDAMGADAAHTFEVNASGKGAIVLIYRVP
jgi:hypothetical protein